MLLRVSAATAMDGCPTIGPFVLGASNQYRVGGHPLMGIGFSPKASLGLGVAFLEEILQHLAMC
jgi:hypothetical protein